MDAVPGGPKAIVGVGGAVVFLLLIVSSFSSITPTEMALRYSTFWKTVDPVPVTAPGWKFVGPWSTLIKYPKTMVTVEYLYDTKLVGRTSDGLPVTLEVKFQYQLNSTNLFKLYSAFESTTNEYVKVFRAVGAHYITEHANNHTAYDFFNNKQGIALSMKAVMNPHFEKHMFASIQSVQLTGDDLPASFNLAIQETTQQKLNITTQTRNLEANLITFHTDRIVAHANANVTINVAQGEAAKINATGEADATIIKQFVAAERSAYTLVKDNLGIKGDALIDYIWYDTLSGGGISGTETDGLNTQVLVGVNPSAYISDQ